MHVRICGGEPRGHPRGLLNGHADGNVGYSQAVAFPDLLAPYPTTLPLPFAEAPGGGAKSPWESIAWAAGSTTLSVYGTWTL